MADPLETPSDSTSVGPAPGALASTLNEPSTPSSNPEPRPAPESDLSGALHEVSNALTVILGWIERARAEQSSPEGVEHALGIAASRASIARDIVRRAIGAEVENGAPRAVGAVIEETLTSLDPEVQRAGATLQLTLDRRVDHIVIEGAAQVLQILTNLVLNALAMSPPGGSIAIDARPRHRQVIFSVSDEGPGIPEHRRMTLFDDGISTRRGGAGLGLRHSAALARSLGGTLSLIDTLQGARFELCWPLSAPVSDSPGDSPSAPPTQPSITGDLSLPPRRPAPLRGSKILLVEDDEAVIDLLDTALSARGADVISIRGRSELGEALSQGPFDAALFYLSPIRDDVEGALSSVRATNAALRVVLISGSAEQMPSLPDAWVSAWVRKPFEISEIVRVLEEKKR